MAEDDPPWIFACNCEGTEQLQQEVTMNRCSEKTWRISHNFPGKSEVKVLFEEKGMICREADFRYTSSAGEKEERRITVEFSFPVLDISGRWYPSCGFDRSIKADWFPEVESMTSISAPVICFFNGKGENRHTIALSEVKQKVAMRYGIHEENGVMLCRIDMILPRGLFLQGYKLRIWESAREEPYWNTLADVRKWWEAAPEWQMMEVPGEARKPFYSFWYSKHQSVDADTVEKECRLAADMGFTSVIVDDGWQTDDNSRGYAFCGDWEPAVKKFPDFAQHVRKVRDMGLKYLMWFSVPYVGKRTKAWERFGHKLLYWNELQQAGVLDIRYPQVREYLKGIYLKAVKDWGIDGLKLDFIDEFYLYDESPMFTEGMDCADVQEALDILLTEVKEVLTSVRPDILIEFRQKYIGPQIRKYGNLLRVSDCPGSGISNRVGIVDLRLLSGATAVHSDMLMWHEEEKTEDAALQVLSCIFSTVQISVSLENITEDMKRMLLFWMSFMQTNEKLLQESQIKPQEPENLYPQVLVEDEETQILVQYSRGRTVDLRRVSKCMYYVHGVKEEEVCIQLDADHRMDFRIKDCRGDILDEGSWENISMANITVPTGGLVKFIKEE